MTKLSHEAVVAAETAPRCHWCGRGLYREHTGRPPKYCRQSCRQRAYESRRRGHELGIGDDELIVTKNELDDVRDRLFEVGELVKDALSGIEDRMDPGDLLERLISGIQATIDTN